jgi:hypothetical protein
VRQDIDPVDGWERYRLGFSGGKTLRPILFVAVLGVLTVFHGAAIAVDYPLGETAMKAAHLAAPVKPTTASEVLSAVGYINRHRFELFDANQDGALTPDEWLEMNFATYVIFNKQRDGHLTLEDYTQFFMGPTEHPFPGGTARSAHEIEGHFKKLDRANKGYLTIEDFRAEAALNFQHNDVNDDGKVTQVEIDDVSRSHLRH